MISHLGEHKLNSLLELAKQTPDGLVLELGVYNGGTIAELAKLFPDRRCYAFDTFEGMPSEFYNETEGHPPGDFKPNFDEVRDYLDRFQNIDIVKGVFPDSYAFSQLDFKEISFIHMDFDHGEPTRLALEMFWDHMVDGGIILFDDYNWQACQNIKPVADEFAAKHGLKVQMLTEHQAYIVKGL